MDLNPLRIYRNTNIDDPGADIFHRQKNRQLGSVLMIFRDGWSLSDYMRLSRFAARRVVLANRGVYIQTIKSIERRTVYFFV